MRKVILFILVAIMALSVAACTQAGLGQRHPVRQGEGDFAGRQPVRPRASSSTATPPSPSTSTGNLRDEDGNLFYSPYSISMALAMTYAGARGETAAQMAAALHYLLPQDRLHPAFNSLDQALASRGQGATGKDGQGFKLHVVNAIWGQQGFKFLAAYLDTLAENYGAGLRVLDSSKKQTNPASPSTTGSRSRPSSASRT